MLKGIAISCLSIRAQQDRGKDPVFCRAPFMPENGRKAGETDMEQKVVLTMRDISKTFPGVKALQHVDFTLREGEIHALMGENGAGKSTLIKVLTGVHDFEAGEIKMAGNDTPIVNKSPQDAQNNGISTVYQEVNLCPNLTVAENLFIGREPRKAGYVAVDGGNNAAGHRVCKLHAARRANRICGFTNLQRV